MMEAIIDVVMSTHVYKFGNKYFLQHQGGPIGLRSTASLASLIMKIWDMSWRLLLEKEKIDLKMYKRYVDDSRCFLRPIVEGWRWSVENKRFEFSKQHEDEDVLSGLTDQARTTRELVLAMSSTCEFLQFEGEEGGMFANSRLPTLDMEIWVDEVSQRVCHSFYEKPTCPNRVVQKDSALSMSSIRATLVQETIRRLKHCSLEVSIEEKQEILSVFAQKMRNSGHTVASIQYILVHGVTKFAEMKRLSELPKTHKSFKPLHCSKHFNMYNRKLHKMMQKAGWFAESEVIDKMPWRHLIPRNWIGDRPSQFPNPGMQYTSIMYVPSSKGGRLLKMLAKAEPRIAKLTGYQVKYIEKPGKRLSKFFSKEKSENVCHRPDCGVCINSDRKKPSMCQVKGVVYSGVCLICDEKFRSGQTESHSGVYIGETSRTLKERVTEHRGGYKRMESSNFMFKHWSNTHGDCQAPPEFQFSVIKKHPDPMGRLIHESIKISDIATLNSKSEWGGV